MAFIINNQTGELTYNGGTLKLAAGAQIEAGTQFKIIDGTVNAPSLTNYGDENTGLYFPQEEMVALVGSGIELLRADGLNGYVTITGNRMPATTGTVGQYLAVTAAGVLGFVSATGGGITKVQDDTAPKLGGLLDTNGYHITHSITDGLGLRIYGATTGVSLMAGGNSTSVPRITVSSSGVSVGASGSNYLLPTARPTVGQFLTATSTTATGWATLATVAKTGSYTDLSSLPALKTVATSGSYNDLINLPTLFSGSYNDLTNKPVLFSGSYTDLTNKPAFATVATTGSYADLLNKPTLFSGAYADLTGKPTLFSGAYADLTGKPTLATVATSGSYTDLLNQPTLFSGAYADLTGKPSLAAVATSGNYSDLLGKPALATVATSGDYNDLINKPSGGGGSGVEVIAYYNMGFA